MAPVVAPAPAAAADLSGFYTDFSSQELMRLTNKDRAALGRKRLKVDTYLVKLARDLPFTCPSTGAVYKGRARDMAARDYLGHGVKGCRRSDGSAYTVQNILRRAGYSTYSGENIGVNNWPDTAARYKYGCSSSGYNCNGTTSTTAPVGTVQRMWMRSSGHRVNILNSNYDRFGCGAWDTSDGHKYFACIFAKGGPKPIDGSAPTFSRVADNTASLRTNDDIVLEISFTDTFRLSDSSVRLDGRMKRGWSYDYNTTTASHSLVIDPASLSRGTHTVVWSIRDVAGHITRKWVTFEIR
jgi:uncharacterized protein YkwD/methionine-rich copper-binding protein CopC